MTKFLLSCAFLLGITGTASALTVQDICKKYNYTGEVYQDITVISNLTIKDVDGWQMSQMSGSLTIEDAGDNNVVVKGLFPGARDLKAVFDPANNTLTFSAMVGAEHYDATYNYTYELTFGTGKVSYDSDGYPLVDTINTVVGKFDENGNLTVEDWMLIDDYYMQPFVYYGYTQCTPDNVVAVGHLENDNAPAVYYNLQGVRVDNPTNGIYIQRQGSKVNKVVL